MLLFQHGGRRQSSPAPCCVISFTAVGSDLPAHFALCWVLFLRPPLNPLIVFWLTTCGSLASVWRPRTIFKHILSCYTSYICVLVRTFTIRTACDLSPMRLYLFSHRVQHCPRPVDLCHCRRRMFQKNYCSNDGWFTGHDEHLSNIKHVISFIRPAALCTLATSLSVWKMKQVIYSQKSVVLSACFLGHQQAQFNMKTPGASAAKCI